MLRADVPNARPSLLQWHCRANAEKHTCCFSDPLTATSRLKSSESSAQQLQPQCYGRGSPSFSSYVPTIIYKLLKYRTTVPHGKRKERKRWHPREKQEQSRFAFGRCKPICAGGHLQLLSQPCSIDSSVVDRLPLSLREGREGHTRSAWEEQLDQRQTKTNHHTRLKAQMDEEGATKKKLQAAEGQALTAGAEVGSGGGWAAYFCGGADAGSRGTPGSNGSGGNGLAGAGNIVEARARLCERVVAGLLDGGGQAAGGGSHWEWRRKLR
eukprot:370367-Pleurochrysis_carterae.AAC.2